MRNKPIGELQAEVDAWIKGVGVRPAGQRIHRGPAEHDAPPAFRQDREGFARIGFAQVFDRRRHVFSKQARDERPAERAMEISAPIRASTILPERNARSAASIKSFERAAACVHNTTMAPHSSMASTTDGDRDTVNPDPCSATARASA